MRTAVPRPLEDSKTLQETATSEDGLFADGSSVELHCIAPVDSWSPASVQYQLLMDSRL